MENIPGFKIKKIEETLLNSMKKDAVKCDPIMKTAYSMGNTTKINLFGYKHRTMCDRIDDVKLNTKDLINYFKDHTLNQVEIRKYKKGDSLPEHVDKINNLTDDTIIMINLIGSCNFTMSRGDQLFIKELYEGDILILEGDARFKWKHGIKDILTNERWSLILRNT